MVWWLTECRHNLLYIDDVGISNEGCCLLPLPYQIYWLIYISTDFLM